MAALTKFGAAFEALRECACAIQSGDLSRADLFMKRALDPLAEQNIHGHYTMERLVEYFAEALARRAYRLLPKYPTDFKSCYLDDDEFYSYTPARLIQQDTIGKAALSGKSKVHLILLSLTCFELETFRYMRELKRLQKVPQLCLKVTLVVTPTSSPYADRLNTIARYRGVTFEFNWVDVESSLDELEVSLLKLDRDDEFVVVDCRFLLGFMTPTALNKFLVMLRDGINPDILLIAEHDANLNQNDFLPRFNESLQYYSGFFAFLEDIDEFPIQHFRNEISNVVACEGGARMVRHMTSDQWRDGGFDFQLKNGCVVKNA